ncbi:MAG: hypothetical protein AAFS10_21645 [Myxococcota bacterium]
MTSNIPYIIPWVLVIALCGCAQHAELHHGLTEAEANTITRVLESNGVEVAKTRDADAANQWTIIVHPQQRLYALQLLHHRGLPRSATNTLPSAGLMGLLPTPSEQHEERLKRTQASLEKTLLAIGGVLDARVHVVLPTSSQHEPVKASILIKHKSDIELDPEQLAQLTAGAVPELDPHRVHVVLSAVPSIAAPTNMSIVSLGPWQVASPSQTPLKTMIASLLIIIVFQSVVIAFVILRGRSQAQGSSKAS